MTDRQQLRENYCESILFSLNGHYSCLHLLIKQVLNDELFEAIKDEDYKHVIQIIPS